MKTMLTVVALLLLVSLTAGCTEDAGDRTPPLTTMPALEVRSGAFANGT
ncbi:MAG: YbhB/YbcL family Raf kinase inhibitor-like protein, partial [Methanoculleus bourgensis]|nr:YbhB/YbcL family Raf kinase inhibitor-like protein [Methanoculleus bourgensis]